MFSSPFLINSRSITRKRLFMTGAFPLSMSFGLCQVICTLCIFYFTETLFFQSVLFLQLLGVAHLLFLLVLSIDRFSVL